MLYAAYEIVFFLLLTTLLGVGLGWWMARSERISVVAAMNRSGAHAAAERELVQARGEIEQLTAKLAIATEAIRELESEGAPPPASTADDTETTNEIDPIEVFPEIPAPPVELPPFEAPVRSADAVDPLESDADDGDPEAGAPVPVERTELVASAVEDDVVAVEDDPGSDVNILRSSKDRGGKRLSARVAEASVFSRRERSAPKIKFESDD